MIELEEIIKAGTKKTIYVMRHQVEQGRSEMLQIKLPKGKMSELGFTYHPICYTARERNRYEQVYGQNVLILEDKANKAEEFDTSKYLYSALLQYIGKMTGNNDNQEEIRSLINETFEEDSSSQIKGDNDIIIFRPIKVDTEYGYPYYQMGIKDPAIILRGRCGNKSWRIGESVIEFNEWGDEDDPITLDMLSTIDGHIETYTFDQGGISYLKWDYNYATVPEKLMKRLQKKASQELK